MQTVVIYDSRFGNTERIAEAIARGVSGQSGVRVMHAADAARAAFPDRPDLVLVGGPTHNRGASAGLRTFTAALPPDLRGIAAVCFDTRYRGPALIMGSAAAAAAKVLAKAGSEIFAPPESFFIARKGPMEAQGLELGELERAEQWGRAVAAAFAPRLARRPAAAAG
jgi:flavodoxin